MKLKIVKGILWFLLGAGTIVGAARFIFGLGATTNLTDTTPWGLWIGFDVMGGVALAAGGFVIAGTVYIFHLERYRSILRPAVLTAFLGYIAVAVGLLFDLGLPWNIWHLIIFWNPKSPLFEVGWCVMLYLTVLLLEFSPVLLEKSPLKKVLAVLKKATVPLVIIGIGLSTLHQSSLGSLILIMPFRLNPLWYSPILPLFFLVSAVGLGLMMVTLESTVSSWLFNKERETELLSDLGKTAAFILGFYAVLKLGDLAFRNNLGMLLNGSWESSVFIFELFISALLPASLLAVPKIRQNDTGLVVCSILVVLGFILNRINVSGIATVRATGSDYLPSLMEISISLWVVSLAILVFFFFVEHFKVYEREVGEKVEAHSLPVFDRASSVWLDVPVFGGIKRNSLMFIMGAIMAFTFLPDEARNGAQPLSIPVERPRISDILIIDGNRSELAVLFDHDKHKQENGEKESCILCHHMRKPLDEYTPCADCHMDMQLITNIFNHNIHQKRLNGNEGCIKCHTDPNVPKSRDSVTGCNSCHIDMIQENALISVSTNTHYNYAGGYKDAMHGLCINCHESKKKIKNKPRLDECGTCHKELPQNILDRLHKLYGKSIAMSGL